MNQRYEAIKKFAESWTDRGLAAVMALPAPFSALVLLAWSAGCVAIGAMFL